ncbi:MAG: DUF924 family protein [Phenylobacterium sp.]|uniref:DUF924 family protein n=1 Tax=Phenylobacterium sp. TaxID=1871053 RepID=UPI002717C12A|nr:DUF924 family protein [Phenylobacterium sp.]MDO8901353.1 DUF924 family protein [Phenylobacterium sp.]MDP2215168.1 DUF924 family protein [Phenylobacterium sp.]
MDVTAQQVVKAWREAGPAKWFAKDEAFDRRLARDFEAAHHAAARGELDAWAETAEGALALLILLDQIPRNIFRGSGHAFATDGKARAIAKAAITAGHDKATAANLRPFFYLPYEHSEEMGDQDEAVRLCATLRAEEGDEDTLKWAEIHRDIIVRFGRFPHRNAALGRRTSPSEQAFLDEGGFSG